MANHFVCLNVQVQFYMWWGGWVGWCMCVGWVHVCRVEWVGGLVHVFGLGVWVGACVGDGWVGELVHVCVWVGWVGGLVHV